jgi:hypothetical protein
LCSCVCVRRSVRAPLKARCGVIRVGLQGDSVSPSVAHRACDPKAATP